jgi:hypothetical protein
MRFEAALDESLEKTMAGYNWQRTDSVIEPEDGCYDVD